MIGNDWDEILKDEYEKEYFKTLQEFVISEYKTKTIYPKMSEIFNTFLHTNYKDIKVVILGQDPYFNENEAEGLSFSVKKGVRKPPTLINIFKELKDDLGYPIPKDGSLVPWAKQGVILLNATLTVIKGAANSHSNRGWEIFTDAVIKEINKKKEPVVFILWGSYARSKKNYITNKIHCTIESSHPSPLAAYRGFFGSRPFSKANSFLAKNNVKPIDWQIK